MVATYQPPSMPPYPVSLDGLIDVMAPYYRCERPADLLFEFYIVDVIGALPRSTDQAIVAFLAQLPALRTSTSGDWRRWVRETFRLSSTIDVAILDLWYRNSANASTDGSSYHPWHYAKDFTQKYFAEGSRIDVWEGNALEEARKRVNAKHDG